MKISYQHAQAIAVKFLMQEMGPRRVRRFAMELLRRAEMADGCADPMPDWASSDAKVIRMHPVSSDVTDREKEIIR